MSKSGKTSHQGQLLLQDLKCYTEHLLNEIQVSPELASQVANELMFQISEHWGGQLIYIVKSQKFLANRRDLEIFRAFDGQNHAELAQQYGLSITYIYRILKRMSALDRQNNQYDLFDTVA